MASRPWTFTITIHIACGMAVGTCSSYGSYAVQPGAVTSNGEGTAVEVKLKAPRDGEFRSIVIDRSTATSIWWGPDVKLSSCAYLRKLNSFFIVSQHPSCSPTRLRNPKPWWLCTDSRPD
eukprot:1962758-Prymnesium_polylepis.1